MSGSEPLDFLSLVGLADNFRLGDTIQALVPWTLSERLTEGVFFGPKEPAPVFGLLRPVIVRLLEDDNERNASLGRPPSWYIIRDRDAVVAVSFEEHLDTPAKRSAVMKELCERWRDKGRFADVIGPKKWRAEMYPVYRDPFGARIEMVVGGKEEDQQARGCPNYAFSMERSACALFGVVTYGVHMTVYEEDGDGNRVKVWVPRRARTKQTWPGYLDNTIAGGIPCGMTPFESLVKEAMEEGNIEESIVRQHARAAGSISYFFRTEADWLQPEIQFVYDLRIPRGLSTEAASAFVPKPLDGEVESFELLDLAEAVSRMRAAEFKPNTALVLIDFMIRNGFITPDNEPDFVSILTRLHGRFEYERWGQGPYWAKS
ncbi:hypothetical protein PUNSTDRAFT_94168 [Punctularia strigosozonata HHB-11173 SS5]|uniref:uncharacterized protein n=1 Tax=Punctularia strigosozonata (strain HHB-11173) TaxID=741275 RepID=UPI0004417CB3|nr:uncharacterized protein PUNSTDRAFT_94168 [Punctularia strigosozonata HHB-11173 SS5]EIN13181.1 hypothetical protein PUNSTDRAFT_94168 [Punctularia strigosozonata HHB-11173 SS5]